MCNYRGGKGLGFSISKKLVSAGAEVLITGRNKNDLEKACSELGDKCKFIVFDVLDFDHYDNFFEKVLNVMPECNAMVLNAGISLHESGFGSVTNEGYQLQFDTNFKAAYFMAQEFVKHFKHGDLLFISSETASMKCFLPYGLSKTLIDSLVPALNYKFYKDGIRVNGIAPGSTITNMVKNVNADANDFHHQNASGRYFLPDEVAEVAAFLLSDASLCIGGEIIHTNAGNHYRPQLQ